MSARSWIQARFGRGPDADRPPRPRVVTVSSGMNAKVVLEGSRVSAAGLVDAIGIKRPCPVILVIGGAESLDPAVEPGLLTLFQRGLVRAAGAAGATVLDGGTASGVMAALGRAMMSSDASAPLVGVAPAGRVTFAGMPADWPHGDTELEANHDGFVLANSDTWGGETLLLFEVLEAMAGSEFTVAVLAGGGDVAHAEVRLAAARRMPILVIEGSGGAADEIVAAAGQAAAGGQGPLVDLVRAANPTFVPIGSPPSDLERILSRLLRGSDEALREAWRLQKLVSDAAAIQQRDFHGSQDMLLTLGLVVTILVVVESVLDRYTLLATAPESVKSGLYVAVILLPIMTAALSAAIGRWRPRQRWILLRGASESIKREIYRYRTHSGMYSDPKSWTRPREVKLADAIASSLGGLMRTDVSQLDLDPASIAQRTRKRWRLRRGSGPDDRPENKMTPLTAADYVRYRVSRQIDYYVKQAGKLERQGRRLRTLAIVFGAVGSFLAAVGLQIWVAVTTAVVGIFTTVIESRQLEISVTFFNQAAADLTSIRSWWEALPEADRETQATIDRLVDRSEGVIRTEHAGWVQEMQDETTQDRLGTIADSESAEGEVAAGAKRPGGADDDRTRMGATPPAGAAAPPPAGAAAPPPAGAAAPPPAGAAAPPPDAAPGRHRPRRTDPDDD